MNETLKARVKEIVTNKEEYEVTLWYEGDFTVCTILDRNVGEVVSVGVTKRNPCADDYDQDRGIRIAVSRAVKGLDGWFETNTDDALEVCGK